VASASMQHWFKVTWGCRWRASFSASRSHRVERGPGQGATLENQDPDLQWLGADDTGVVPSLGWRQLQRVPASRWAAGSRALCCCGDGLCKDDYGVALGVLSAAKRASRDVSGSSGRMAPLHGRRERVCGCAGWRIRRLERHAARWRVARGAAAGPSASHTPKLLQQLFVDHSQCLRLPARSGPTQVEAVTPSSINARESTARGVRPAPHASTSHKPTLRPVSHHRQRQRWSTAVDGSEHYI